MIPNCKACKIEWYIACEAVKKGYHIATIKDQDLFGKEHFFIIIVDDNGKALIW